MWIIDKVNCTSMGFAITIKFLGAVSAIMISEFVQKTKFNS